MKKFFYNLYFTFLHRTNMMKKLLISYIMLIFIPLLILTYFSYSHVSQTLIQQFEYSSNMSMQQTKLYLDNLLNNIIDSTEEIAYSNTLTQIFHKDFSRGSLMNSYQDFLTINNLMNNIFASNDLYSVEFFTTGKYVTERRGEMGNQFISIQNPYAQKLNEHLASFRGEILWFPPQIITNTFTKEENPVITGARYINSSSISDNLGIIAVNLRQDSLNSIIGRSAILSNSIILLFDTNGNIMAVSDAALFEKYGLSSETILEHIAGNHSLNTDNGTMLLNSTSLEASDWNLVSVIPYDEILLTSINTRNRMLLTMFIISVLFYLIAYLISNLLTKKIRHLAAHMKGVQFDNYSPIVYVDGSDEISDLARSYNIMLNKINNYAESQYQLGLALKTSELTALQAQINPHFLYNTLDLLHWLARDYCANEISEIVSLLSQYYKLSLSNGVDVITIMDAIKHIEIYVQLQNYRFNNPITLTLNVDSSIYDYGILKLLLQPIVENAIIHGILEKETQTGSITINGYADKDILYFQIIDDGVGMSQDQINFLINATNTDNSTKSSYSGYGIRNVIDRVKLYYGSEYGLNYESELGKGTSVVVRIPRLEIPLNP